MKPVSLNRTILDLDQVTKSNYVIGMITKPFGWIEILCFYLTGF